MQWTAVDVDAVDAVDDRYGRGFNAVLAFLKRGEPSAILRPGVASMPELLTFSGRIVAHNLLIPDTRCAGRYINARCLPRFMVDVSDIVRTSGGERDSGTGGRAAERDGSIVSGERRKRGARWQSARLT